MNDSPRYQERMSDSSFDRLIGFFADARHGKRLLDIVLSCTLQVSLMEVCGTHTVAFFTSGIRQALAGRIRLISGPGCPVCVTPPETIEIALGLAQKERTVLFCFGDMLRVTGRTMSLETVQGIAGVQVRMMYSPLEALDFAQRNPGQRVILFGVGFETTIPLFASVVLRAEQMGLDNLFVLPAFKCIPPALRALLSERDRVVDGLILPGHVSAIIGAAAYSFLDKHAIPAVITGFESVDLLEGVAWLLEMIQEKRPAVKNQYSRVVSPEGNFRAWDMVQRVFKPVDAVWRGLGAIPLSGLTFTPAFERFNAERFIDFDVGLVEEHTGCLCGEVIKGKKSPGDCPLYKSVCTLQHPVGPCMVSQEGTCAAYFKYAH